MPASKTHNQVVLRPPPGTRFTIFGSDCLLEFERNRVQEVYDWLQNWLDSTFIVEIERHKAYVQQQKQAELAAKLELENAERAKLDIEIQNEAVEKARQALQSPAVDTEKEILLAENERLRAQLAELSKKPE
jgi:hypothetical protein